MTKYILHGGNTSENYFDNRYFFKSMTDGFRGEVKVLLNYFSRPLDEWKTLEKEDSNKIKRLSKAKKVSCEVATVDDFLSQLKRADVMYMRGGDTLALIKHLKRYPKLTTHFEGKVIAGSSAGVYALSKYYYTNDRRRIEKGLGVLNIKVYCHYLPDDKNTVERLLKYKESLEFIVLPSFKSVVIYK